MILLTLLTKRDLNCNTFFPRNGTQVNCFLGANKYTSFFKNNYSDAFLDAKISKFNRVTIFSKKIP